MNDVLEKLESNPKKVENIFFFTEVGFLLIVSAIALYNILFDKDLIPLIVILGGYILSIKALRRMVLETKAFKRNRNKFITILYLTVSTYAIIHVFVMMIS